MVIRRALAGLAMGALLVTGCSTGDTEGGGDSEGGDSGGGGGGSTEAGDVRIDVVTHGAPGDSFWDVVKSGAEKAGEDLGVELNYQSDPDPGQQSTLIDSAVADGTDGLVVSMANPDGLEAAIRAAVEGGVPVITINSGIDDWQPFGAITHVGQSETIAGETAGEQLNEAGATNVICVIQEAGNVALEDRCAGAASTFEGDMENLQADNADLPGSQSTIEAKLQGGDIDGILTLGGDMSGAAVAAVEASGGETVVGTFDLNADVAQNVLDGNLLFAIDQQPYVQGYLGVTGIYLKAMNGNDIGGGQPVYSGPAVITQENAEAVLGFAQGGTR